MRPTFTYIKRPSHGRGGNRYDYDADKILHSAGEWSLRKAPATDNIGREVRWKSYIYHNVEKQILQQNPWVAGKPPEPKTYWKKVACRHADIPLLSNQCTKCRNTIPDGLVALWKLHNYEALQSGEY